MSGTPRLASRTLLGALAGLAGTAVMTIAMNRLHRRLPAPQRYPLPPREITETVLDLRSDETVKDVTTAAHFAYGAGSGALLAAALPSSGPLEGAAAGSAVWAVSYFGWVPALGILNPADRHPMRRNALMIGAHLVWGAVTALVFRELVEARGSMLRSGPPLDRDRNQ